MGLQHYVLFVFLTMISVLNLLTSVRVAATDLCQKTEHPEICKSIVKNEAADMETAIQMSIQAAIDQTNHAKAMLHVVKVPQDAMGKSSVQACYENYDTAIANLKKSSENLTNRSMADLKINLSAAITNYATCDSGFTDDAGHADPVAKINVFLGQIASNGLTLASDMASRDL